MAVHRTPPNCPLCGKEIKGMHRPAPPDFVGDTFSHWDWAGHARECDKNREHLDMYALCAALLNQIEMCDYQTTDTLHDLKNNKAYCDLKEYFRKKSEPSMSDGDVISALQRDNSKMKWSDWLPNQKIDPGAHVKGPDTKLISWLPTSHTKHEEAYKEMLYLLEVLISNRNVNEKSGDIAGDIKIVQRIVDQSKAAKLRSLDTLTEQEAYKMGVYGVYRMMHDSSSWNIQYVIFSDIAKLVAAGFDITPVLNETDLSMLRKAGL